LASIVTKLRLGLVLCLAAATDARSCCPPLPKNPLQREQVPLLPILLLSIFSESLCLTLKTITRLTLSFLLTKKIFFQRKTFGPSLAHLSFDVHIIGLLGKFKLRIEKFTRI
jgi:hypothetical protein